jgi:uncharacterized protein YggE
MSAGKEAGVVVNSYCAWSSPGSSWSKDFPFLPDRPPSLALAFNPPPVRRLALPFAAAALLLAASVVSRPAVAQVQLACAGTLLEARGSAEAERPTRRLGFSLGLEAEASGGDGAATDAALALLQRRLAAVRSALQRLEVEELRVSSPTTWRRTDPRGRPAAVQASLQISGRLAPQRLQPLIREVGALPGVRLAPVTAQSDPAEDQAVRRRLLRQAYQDALARASEVGAAIGRLRIEPLEVQLDAGELRPMPMMARADAAAPPPFDPAELPQPKDRLTLLARFCAR